MLHIINDPSTSSSLLEKAHFGDTVIFTENAVLAIKQENFSKESFAQKALSHINLYVRKADLLLRNIPKQELLRGVIIIDESQYNSAITDYFAFKSYN